VDHHISAGAVKDHLASCDFACEVKVDIIRSLVKIAGGDRTVINDLSYILSKLPDDKRQALVDQVTALIEAAAAENGIPLN